MNAIISFAVKEEMFCVDASGVRSIITGVGKANAAYRLTKAIAECCPDVVINIGTAGTRDFRPGDTLVATHFVDRDLMPLEIAGVETDITTACSLQLPSIVGGSTTDCRYTVNTGDDFVTAGEAFAGDVVDMEAFALATVCKNEGVDFVAVKYVTDVIGSNSVKLWSEKLAEAQESLCRYFERYIAPQL